MASRNFFDPPAGHEPPRRDPRQPEALSVSQLTARIERALKEGLPATVLVRGEVSNFKQHGGSGHLYFTLKDPGSCIDCVMFRSDAVNLRFTPQDGMELLATGRIAVYAQRGRYQLYVARLEAIGQGALEVAFRQLCAKLQAEGLFDPARKQPLPPYPMRVALLTSADTAAFQDMLKVLRRFAWVRLLLWHVPVQGEGAAQRIAQALVDLGRRHHQLGGVDLILLARGGGSLEDLWAFNEEVVARAIAGCPIPIITGIGHEIDVSVADLVADYHAHTPTEAAQVAMARWRTAREDLEALGIRLRREVRTLLGEARSRLSQLQRHEVFRRPTDRINAARQQLDDRQRALAAAMQRRLTVARQRLMGLGAVLAQRHPRHQLALMRLRLGDLSRRLAQELRRLHRRLGERLAAIASHLNAVGPQQVLERGYSITTLQRTGRVLRSAHEARAGDRLLTRLAEGTLHSVVEDQRQLRLFE